MKKNSIALAIVALSAPAFAGDVTVYGILDSGYSNTTREVTQTNGTSIKMGKAAIAWSQCVTSRLGVLASEDLGGGMKVTVKVETGLTSNPMGGITQGDNTTFYKNATTGALATNGTTQNSTVLGDRELNATLDFGQGTALKIGFGSSPIRDFTFAYDSALQGNFVGSLITTDPITSNNRSTAISLIQQMGPVKASIGVMRNTDTIDRGADQQWPGGTFTGLGNGYQAALQYVDKALSIGLAYQSAERTTTAAFGNAANTNDLTTKVGVFGVSYDFGFLKLTGQYADIKLDDSIAANAVGEGKRSHENLGVSVPVGAGTLFAQISKGKQDQVAAATVASVSRDLSGFTVGGKYNFTKGTYAYVSYGQSELKVGAATDNVANRGVKANQYTIGLVKVF